jgi:hypothetical protein
VKGHVTGVGHAEDGSVQLTVKLAHGGGAHGFVLGDRLDVVHDGSPADPVPRKRVVNTTKSLEESENRG